tara:strand:+ start:202 stop:1017 length:816 start_codon:yes stop_codon:yes gene_type:complete
MNNNYDILCIKNDIKTGEIIHSILNSKCLGAHFINQNVKLYFENGIKDKIQSQLIEISSYLSFKWEWEIETPKDWHLNWQEYFTPIIINKNLAIVPYWEPNQIAKITIKIKPGMAFGTGHHETTYMMLKQLYKNNNTKINVLDLGTGSGILSIAALKLGAKNIHSVENDSDCILNFKENLSLNNIKKNIKYYSEDVLKWNKFNYDLILANINKDIIEKLIPKLKLSNTKIILSGLLKDDFIDIKKKCDNHNIKIKERIIKGDWICIILCAN